MLNSPYITYIVVGCLLLYVFLLGYASFPTSWVPSTSYGVYYNPVGKLLPKSRINRSGKITEPFPEPNGTSLFDLHVSTIKTLEENDYWNKCSLPKYDIWDEDILPYVEPDKDPYKNCNKNFKPFTYLYNQTWGVHKEWKHLKCRARCHTRKNDRVNIISEWTYTPGQIICEFVETVCSKNGTDTYGYLHSQVIPTTKMKPKVDITSLMQYDVFVILLDSLSTSQAERSLPRTLSYFTKHMKGVTFPYVNKIGENSRPNGIPIWFGKSLETVDRTMFDEGVIKMDWPHKYFCKTYKDNETNLFRDFQEYGYKTLLAEDWAEGTMNWPNCVGWLTPPMDHYMRPFQNAYERRRESVQVTQKHLDGHLCREYHHTLLDYMEQFMQAYPDDPKFGWIWAIVLGHNSENGFAHADKDFHKYLINNRRTLDNSFLFIMGDHGLRFGSVRDTFVGGLDVNNPFTALSIPKALRENTDMLEIMKENAKQLQTHFDTRATILDIMKYQSKNKFMDQDPLDIPEEKGNSYIRRQPDTPRTCRTLPIPLEYCICQFASTPVPTNTTIAEKIGRTVTSNVNQQLKDNGHDDKCIEMKFKKVLSLLMYDHKFKGATLYIVTAEMEKPSGAIFKANVKVINDEVKILGTIERNNKYGKTADCLTAEYYRPYCYCKDQNDKKVHGNT